VNARTALINQLRAILLERGIILPKERVNLMRCLEPLMMVNPAVSDRTRALLSELRDQWAGLDRRIKDYDDELAALTQEDEQARRLATIPGIGVINATALLAAIGDGSAFAKGHDLAAWRTPPGARPNRGEHAWGSTPAPAGFALDRPGWPLGGVDFWDFHLR